MVVRRQKAKSKCLQSVFKVELKMLGKHVLKQSLYVVFRMPQVQVWGKEESLGRCQCAVEACLVFTVLSLESICSCFLSRGSVCLE